MPNPTYQKIGDHTETTQIDFDPSKVTYERLLEVFWETHNPCATAYSRQYASIIFAHDEKQKKAAEASKRKLGKDVQTEIVAYEKFTLAEEYHQKYYLQQNRALFKEVKAAHPDFVNSTAATRINGYLGGFGSKSGLEKEIESFGLSSEGRRILLSGVSYKNP